MDNDVKTRGNGSGRPPGPQEPQVQEPEETGEAGPLQDPEVERLQQELGTAHRRVDELARAYQALNADREEFKQRLNRERERMIDVEKGKVAQTLLEAIDELDRSLSASPQDASPLAKGVRLIRDNLLSKALASGIERLSLVGQTFDPNLAEAVDMEITPDRDRDQEVVSEITAGYRLKGRVIRAARVKVAKYVKPAEA
ncbi:MAG: nucleotide exchange factor GrpE [Myxococcota bacterium]|nr:nucleotide exchange factor GrpE [Myxococcota bacterium]